MKPLMTNRRILNWLNICSDRETTCKFVKMIRNWFTVIFLFVQLSLLVGSVLFFIKYWSINLADAFFAFFEIDATIGLISTTMVAIMLRKNITAIFQYLGRIYTACNLIIDLMRSFLFKSIQFHNFNAN